MKIAVLGTGVVGINLANKLVAVGHQVRLGSRTENNKAAMEWAKKAGASASHGTFTDAASFGEIVFNCTNGSHSLEALKQAGERNLNGKTLVDVANPLKFDGEDMTLFVSNTDSLAEQIQRAFPKAKVVKALNTVNTVLQVNPTLLKEQHDIFISGDDPKAKAEVEKILRSFGWKSVIDLGGIKAARGMEALMLFWLNMYKTHPGTIFNYRIVFGKQ